ncbi:MAG: farnesyl diphosphate synthase [Pseudomonadota bacterium]
MWSDALHELKLNIDATLPDFLPEQSQIAQPVVDAMRHSVLGGGKRLRPLLVCAANRACNGITDAAIPAACAIEFIHAYSLIHDDLPAMDDDDVRHGLPSAHVKYGEANAILAGDSLHSLAFQTIIKTDHQSAEIRVKMIELLAEAAGWAGMAGGQCLDIAAEGMTLTLDELKALHAAKTGALIRVGVQLGALSAQTMPDDPVFKDLSRYGDLIGLAFQVMDDVLDVTATTEQLGKPAGSDEALGKNTFPRLMGVAPAKQLAQNLIGEAKEILNQGQYDSQLLHDLADLVIIRDH